MAGTEEVLAAAEEETETSGVEDDVLPVCAEEDEDAARQPASARSIAAHTVNAKMARFIEVTVFLKSETISIIAKSGGLSRSRKQQNDIF